MQAPFAPKRVELRLPLGGGLTRPIVIAPRNQRVQQLTNDTCLHLTDEILALHDDSMANSQQTQDGQNPAETLVETATVPYAGEDR